MNATPDLLEALKPFGAHAKYWVGASPDQAVFTSLKKLKPGERDCTGNATIYVRDLRRAEAAIAKATGDAQ